VKKGELIAALAERRGISRARAELVVNTIFSAMSEALAGEGRIELRGFGTFQVRESRAGRDLRTGLPVAPGRVVLFRPSAELRAAVDPGVAGRLPLDEAIEASPPSE
jgi:integration host factor subunit beta